MKISFTTVLVSLIHITNALIPLTVKGKRFIKPNTDASVEGEVFFIKGIDYQPGGSSGYDSSSGEDALTDTESCFRDAYIFQQLGINTVRIYSLNPDLDHDECVTIFNNAGIYLLLDVNSGEYGSNLNRADPEGTYDSVYLTRVFKFIEAFKNYPNVLGFFSGNEVINDQSDYAETVPKYIRAVQRDMKQYISKHSNRTIPVGYSAADNTDLRRATLEYLQCHISGNQTDYSSSDFFGLNSYEWCSGTSDWTSSGYDVLNSTLANTTIPLLFSEFGCNTNSPRTFDEVTDGLFGGLINTFSGGLVYEYSQEVSNYGLVTIQNNGSVQYLQDFENLKDQYSNTTPTIYSDDVSGQSIITCNSDRITDIYADFGADFDIPDQPDEITDLIKNGVNATNIGQLIDDLSAKQSNYSIYNVEGDEIPDAIVVFSNEDEINTQSNLSASTTVLPSTASSVTSSATATSSTRASSSSKGAAANVYHVSTASGLIGFFFSIMAYLV